MRLQNLTAVALIGVTLSMSATAVAQANLTLHLNPNTGTPGAAIQLSGDGYPDDAVEIRVEWGFQGQRMEASPSISNGMLTGTALVPDDAIEGVGRVQVCVSYFSGFDDVPQTDCVEATFFVNPLITIVPQDGTPGILFELASSSFSRDSPSEWEVRWEDGNAIASALVDAEGVLTGKGVIPRNAAEGPSTIEVCRPDIDLGSVCYPASPPFEVRYPDARAEPTEVLPGGVFEVSGDEWCCSGERGEVLDSDTREVWGEVFVDADRRLSGTALVPEGTPPGERPLAVCVEEFCRPVSMLVLPPPTTTSVPPGECGGSLSVDPTSGVAGSSIRVTMTGAEGAPDDCLTILELDGRQIGGLEIIPGSETTTEAAVPGDMTPGPVELMAIDTEDGQVLDSVSFIVAGIPADGGFPWIWVIAAAAGLVIFLGVMRALTRSTQTSEDPGPKPPEPQSSVPVVPARWLEARLYARSSAETSVAYFRAGASHRIEVTVGAADLIQEEATPNNLKVILTEPRLLPAPQTAELTISDSGPSSPASLTMQVPNDAASVDARLLLVDGDRVVQTARLPRKVGSPPAGQPINVAEVETVARGVGVPPVGSRVAASFVVDGGRFPNITQVPAAGEPRVIRLIDTGAEAVERIRQRLGEIVEAPDAFTDLDAESTKKLLVYLANQGRLLRSALVSDFLGETLATSPSLQVVSSAPDAYLPLELAYDHPAPREDAKVCPHAGNTLRSLDPLAPCPGPHDDTVVCPVGFWATSKVIERHAFQSRNDLPDGFLVAAQPLPGRERIDVASGVLVGPSERVNAHDPNTIAWLQERMQNAAARSTFVDSWTAWDHEVASGNPSVLVLLPHTVYSGELELPGLEIGASDRRWASAIVDGAMVPLVPVIILLLGCETAVAGAVSYERFPGNLRRAGASIVIATLTDVLGRHAAPIAERLVALITDHTTNPIRLGEIMVRLRRQLLAEGMPVVLALAVFGDGGWLVEGR